MDVLSRNICRPGATLSICEMKLFLGLFVHSQTNFPGKELEGGGGRDAIREEATHKCY